MRAGKGPFFVAEEFAFEQILWNPAAVDRDKRFILARASLMNGECGQLFSGATFA